jgi:hypothetical protein
MGTRLKSAELTVLRLPSLQTATAAQRRVGGKIIWNAAQRHIFLDVLLVTPIGP